MIQDTRKFVARVAYSKHRGAYTATAILRRADFGDCECARAHETDSNPQEAVELALDKLAKLAREERIPSYPISRVGKVADIARSNGLF